MKLKRITFDIQEQTGDVYQSLWSMDTDRDYFICWDEDNRKLNGIEI